MIQETATTDTNIIYTLATGTIDKDDMKRLIPVVEEKIKCYGKVRWYYEMKDFSGWKIDGFFEDVKFDLRHANDFEKIAMVGEKSWQDFMTQLMKPFTSAQIQYFDLKDSQIAKEWIQA